MDPREWTGDNFDLGWFDSLPITGVSMPTSTVGYSDHTDGDVIVRSTSPYTTDPSSISHDILKSSKPTPCTTESSTNHTLESSTPYKTGTSHINHDITQSHTSNGPSLTCHDLAKNNTPYTTSSRFISHYNVDSTAISSHSINHDITESTLVNHDDITESTLISHDDITESTLISHDGITKSKLISHDYITESRLINHDVITESRLTNHDDITENSLINHDGITESRFVNHDDLTESRLINHDDITESKLINHDDIIENRLINHDGITESRLVHHDDITENRLINNDDITESTLVNHDDITESILISQDNLESNTPDTTGPLSIRHDDIRQNNTPYTTDMSPISHNILDNTIRSTTGSSSISYEEITESSPYTNDPSLNNYDITKSNAPFTNASSTISHDDKLESGLHINSSSVLSYDDKSEINVHIYRDDRTESSLYTTDSSARNHILANSIPCTTSSSPARHELTKSIIPNSYYNGQSPTCHNIWDHLGTSTPHIIDLSPFFDDMAESIPYTNDTSPISHSTLNSGDLDTNVSLSISDEILGSTVPYISESSSISDDIRESTIPYTSGSSSARHDFGESIIPYTNETLPTRNDILQSTSIPCIADSSPISHVFGINTSYAPDPFLDMDNMTGSNGLVGQISTRYFTAPSTDTHGTVSMDDTYGYSPIPPSDTHGPGWLDDTYAHISNPPPNADGTVWRDEAYAYSPVLPPDIHGPGWKDDVYAYNPNPPPNTNDPLNLVVRERGDTYPYTGVPRPLSPDIHGPGWKDDTYAYNPNPPPNTNDPLNLVVGERGDTYPYTGVQRPLSPEAVPTPIANDTAIVIANHITDNDTAGMDKKTKSAFHEFWRDLCNYAHLNRLFQNLHEDDKHTITEPDEAIVTEMFPHQKQALHWMMEQENSNKLPPFWQRIGRTSKYYNLTTREITRKRPKSIRGGILADEMGLGKTLAMIALIMTNNAVGKPLRTAHEDTKHLKVKLVRDKGSWVCLKQPIDRVGRKRKAVSLARKLKRKKLKPSGLRRNDESNDAGLHYDNTVFSSRIEEKPEEVQHARRAGAHGSHSERKRNKLQHNSSNQPSLPILSDCEEELQNEQHWEYDSSDLPGDVGTMYQSANSPTPGPSSPTPGPSFRLSEDDDISIVYVSSEARQFGTCTPELKGSDVDTMYQSTNSPTAGPSTFDENDDISIVYVSSEARQFGTCTPELKGSDVDTMYQSTNSPTAGPSTFDENDVTDAWDYPRSPPTPGRYMSALDDDISITDEIPGSTKFKANTPEIADVGGCGKLASRPKGTLIVCPLSVMCNWRKQLREHLCERVSLQVYTHHGPSRVTDPEILKQADVVLTTYSTVASDSKGDHPLKKVLWLRLVLDEGHYIRNPQARQTKAILELKARRKWVITGTPLQNSLKDLWSILKFLRIYPLTNTYCWHYAIELTGLAFQRVSHLMRAIALRRTKTQEIDGKPLVQLPAKKVFVERIKLSDEERKVYDTLQGSGQLVIRKYVEQGTLLHHYGQVLAILMRLRQLCCHPDLLTKAAQAFMEFLEAPPKETNEDALKKRLVETLLMVLQSGSDEECSICLDSLNKAVITPCAHVYCRNCIETVIKNEQPTSKCPLCRGELKEEGLVKVPPELEVKDPPFTVTDEDWQSSPKVDALLKSLIKLREEDPTVKSIVVSQFTSFLRIIEIPLRKHGFMFTKFDGTMSADKRREAMEEFSVPGADRPSIMLLSLKAGGVGINLVAASRVFLMDPAWNPASEEQCFDRCHRLGQTRDVVITKFVVEESVEERMLYMQEKKRRLMQEAFVTNQNADQLREQRINEIIDLMNL